MKNITHDPNEEREVLVAVKKKCGGKKCSKPECNPSDVQPGTRTLRAKCLELALVTCRVEDDALKWAKRYWQWVSTGD